MPEVEKLPYIVDASDMTRQRQILSGQALGKAPSVPLSSLSKEQQKRLNQRRATVSLQHVSQSPVWAAGLGLWSYESALREELVNVTSTRDEIARLMHSKFGYDPKIEPNANETRPLDAHELCASKYGGPGKQKFNIFY